MNIIDIQDQLKNFSEQQLIGEMQMPSGTAPQFLVLSEIQRRKRMRDDFTKRQAAQEPTVAQEALAAAGVPMGGIAGMSEAMAPKSSMAQNGIGSVMPQSMRQAVPDTSAQMPMPTDAAMPMAEGGVVRAQQGTYFPSTAELYGLYGQESGYGQNLYGSAGEIGPLQILPSTAIMPGYGIKSLFPELESAIQRGDYEDAAAAYAANKAMVDEALMSGQRVEPFVIDYLDKAESILGNRNLALLAYNQGIAGTEGYEGDPTETDYVSGVMGNQEGYERQNAINNVTNILSNLSPISTAEASTLTPATQSASAPIGATTTTQGNTVGMPSLAKPAYSEDDKTNIIGGIKMAMGPMAIRGLGEQYYGKDPDIDAALLERGYNPGGMAVVTSEPATAVEDVTLPSGEVIQSGETIPAGTTMSQSQAYGMAIPSETSGGSIGEEPVVEANKFQESSTIEEVFPPSVTQPKSTDGTTPPPVGTTTTTQGNTVGMPSVQPEKPEPKEPESTSLEDEIKNMQAKLEKGREQDKWLAIAQAGLALMSSKEPTLLGAAGEAGVEGLKAFREANERYQEGVVDLINARAKLKGKSDTLKQKDILDANVEILKDPLATVEEKQRARMIVDTMMSGSGYGLVTIPKQAQQ